MALDTSHLINRSSSSVSNQSLRSTTSKSNSTSTTSTINSNPNKTYQTQSLHLNKTHGLFRTLSLMMGIMIGSGIFITVHHISVKVPNSGMTILIYFCMGCLSLMGSFCFAELGTCFPDTGGDFVYLKKLVPNKLLGDLFAFLRIFIELLVIRPGSHAAIALTVSKYLIIPFTGGLLERAETGEAEILKNETRSLALLRNARSESETSTFVLNTTVASSASLNDEIDYDICADFPKKSETEKDFSIIALEVAVAIILTIILTLINAYSMKLTKLLGDVLSVTKVCVLLALVMLGIITISRGQHVGLIWTSDTDGLWDTSTWSNNPDMTVASMIGKLVMASYAGQWSYAGWSDVNYAMEEIVNPSKNYPIAAAISMVTVTLLYSAIVTGFYSVLSHKEIICGIDATTTLFCEKALGYDEPNLTIRIAIAIAVSLSTAGALHGSFFATSRLFFSGSRTNHLPPVFGGLHRVHKTPIPSLFILCILSCIYCLLPFVNKQAITFLINSTCYLYFLSIAACVLLLIIWRLKGRPNAGSVLDKIDMGKANENVDFDNTRVLMNETAGVGNVTLNETRYYQEMTLDDVFTMPLAWHILYTTISFAVTIYALFADWKTCGFGLIFIFLGLPIYFFLIKDKSDLTKNGEIIPNQAGTITKSIFNFLNCKSETSGLVKDDKMFVEPSTDELLANKTTGNEIVQETNAEVYDI